MRKFLPQKFLKSNVQRESIFVDDIFESFAGNLFSPFTSFLMTFEFN